MKSLADIQSLIVDVPDFPKAGILFKDITPVLSDSEAFRSLCMHFAELVPRETTKLVAIESRGFILGAALAQHLHVGLVLVRKPGKLPRQTHKLTYNLEYGTDSLEIHLEDLSPNDNITIIDDVLATGGTASATEQLVKKTGAKVLAHLFLMEIPFLKGREKLSVPACSLLKV